MFTTWNDAQLGSVRTIDVRSGRETVTDEGGREVLSSRGSRRTARIVAFTKAEGGYLTSPWQGMAFGVFAPPPTAAASRRA